MMALFIITLLANTNQIAVVFVHIIDTQYACMRTIQGLWLNEIMTHD
jgi:hypothetical protein